MIACQLVPAYKFHSLFCQVSYIQLCFWLSEVNLLLVQKIHTDVKQFVVVGSRLTFVVHYLASYHHFDPVYWKLSFILSLAAWNSTLSLKILSFT